jgi:uncharacterized protein YbbC (DUF1343 family)
MIRNGLSLLIFLFFTACNAQQEPDEFQIGAARMNQYLPLLEGKNVAMVVNQTSEVNGAHLVDTLLSRGVNIVKVMAPEHGFRGEAPDGEKIDDSRDEKTGIPIVSIYGKTKKPSPEMLEGVDVIIFDIQDVGVRFYTFISTMHYVMEAAAENQKQVIVLDRPNPNGMYIDGPIKDESVTSFVGMHPIPIVHGLTVGELAQMINGEQWLSGEVKSELTVIPMTGWDHTMTYSLPIKPSPNLPNDNAIALYPSLALFEGTVVSVGRGTDYPFEQIGHPLYSRGAVMFTPTPNEGSKYPPLEGEKCKGYAFYGADSPRGFTLKWLIDFYNDLSTQTEFFKDYLTLLAGTEELRKQIELGLTEEQIRATWQPSLNAYKVMRKQYLLYPDFE